MKRSHVVGLLSQIQHRVSDGPGDVLAPDELQTLVVMTTALMLAAMSGAGECRKATPFSPLQPVLDDDGFRWCCTHPTPHCSKNEPV